MADYESHIRDEMQSNPTANFGRTASFPSFFGHRARAPVGSTLIVMTSGRKSLHGRLGELSLDYCHFHDGADNLSAL